MNAYDGTQPGLEHACQLEPFDREHPGTGIQSETLLPLQQPNTSGDLDFAPHQFTGHFGNVFDANGDLEDITKQFQASGKTGDMHALFPQLPGSDDNTAHGAYQPRFSRLSEAHTHNYVSPQGSHASGCPGPDAQGSSAALDSSDREPPQQYQCDMTAIMQQQMEMFTSILLLVIRLYAPPQRRPSWGRGSPFGSEYGRRSPPEHSVDQQQCIYDPNVFLLLTKEVKLQGRPDDDVCLSRRSNMTTTIDQ